MDMTQTEMMEKFDINYTHDVTLLQNRTATSTSQYDIILPSIASIDRYVTPLWYAIGIPGNLLAFVTWMQTRMLPSGCYLAALALDECLFLILQIFFELETRWQISLLQHPGVCQLYPVLFLTSQYLSPLLVLGFTVERYISVCHPFQRKRFCTCQRALIVIVCVVVVTLLINSIQAYFFVFNEGVCEIRPEVTINGGVSFWSIWSWVTELLVFGLVPLSILVLNVFVMNETKKLSCQEEELRRSVKRKTSHDRRSVSRSFRRSSSTATTLMLLVVSFYLIITTLPVTICYVLHYSFPEHVHLIPADDRWTGYFVYRNLRKVVEEFGMSHYALNFYIYLYTGKIFRKELYKWVSKMASWCRH